MIKMKLRKELRSVGAGEHEADKLADVAISLKKLKPHGLSAETKRRLAPKPELSREPHGLRWAVAGTFATACLLLIVAQSALPGSWLYGLKRKTETIRTQIQPDYQDNLVEKREAEVQELKQMEKADPAVLEEAEKNYQNSFERSYNRWNKDNPEKNIPERIKPKYDWSKRWYQNRNYTQGATNDVRGVRDWRR